LFVVFLDWEKIAITHVNCFPSSLALTEHLTMPPYSSQPHHITTSLHSVTPKLLETRAKLKSLQKRVADHDKSKARVQKVSTWLYECVFVVCDV